MVSYILITPARNEALYIAQTIESILAQTHRPAEWIIVSDGSTDATDAIVAKYAAEHHFIQLVRACDRGERNFGSKVMAFNAGYKAVTCGSYQFIGNIDADVTFGNSYFAEILARFESDQQLGIGGGLICELDHGRYVAQTMNIEKSVAGAVQLFRRECFEQIGGYRPIASGGIDSAAEIMARMHRWKVKTFSELPVLHHRRVAIGQNSRWGAMFQKGINNLKLGYHPAYQFASSLYRCKDKPYVIGGLLSFLGYMSEVVRGSEAILPEDVVRYLHAEQVTTLKNIFTKFGRV